MNEELNSEESSEEQGIFTNSSIIENDVIEETTSESETDNVVEETTSESETDNVVEEDEIKEKILYAHYTNETKSVIRMYYIDPEDGMQKTGVWSNQKIIPIINRLYETYTEEDLTRNYYFMLKKEYELSESLEEYVEFKKSGGVYATSLAKLKSLTLEDLFKLKLEIFEEEIVQNSENIELRSLMRKSNDIIELLHHYYVLLEEEKNKTLEITEE